MQHIDSLVQEYPSHLRVFRRNILREYLQYKMLDIIFSAKKANKLTFLGGTALRIVYQTQRFSEDLDFDNYNLSLEDFEEIALLVKKGMEKEGYLVEIRTVSKEAFRCYIRLPKLLFDSNLTSNPKEKVLIQLDTYPHNFEYTPDKKIINKFDVFTQINVTPLDILLSQKIFAAFNRKRAKGRDFFDLTFLFSKTKPNYDYLKLKIDVENATDLKAFMLEKADKLDFEKLADDVAPFLFKADDKKKVNLFGEYLKQVEF